MQYVFVIRSRAGGKKYISRLRLVTYFLPPALERIKNTYCMGQRPFLYFHLIPERHGQTERRTDRQNWYINIARQCADAR